MKAEYDKNKDRLYRDRPKTRPKKGQKPPKGRVLAFNEVKDKIEYKLTRKKSVMKRRKWESELVRNSGFKVNEDKLEGE